MKKEGQPRHEQNHNTEKAKGWLRRKSKSRTIALLAVGSVAAAGAVYLAIHGIHHPSKSSSPVHDAIKQHIDRKEMGGDSSPVHDAIKQHLERKEMGGDSSPVHDAIAQHLSKKEMGGDGSGYSPQDAMRSWLTRRFSL